VLIHSSQHPRDGLNKQLHEAVNRHLHPLKHFFSRLVEGLSRLCTYSTASLKRPTSTSASADATEETTASE